MPHGTTKVVHNHDEGKSWRLHQRNVPVVFLVNFLPFPPIDRETEICVIVKEGLYSSDAMLQAGFILPFLLKSTIVSPCCLQVLQQVEAKVWEIRKATFPSCDRLSLTMTCSLVWSQHRGELAVIRGQFCDDNDRFLKGKQSNTIKPE